MEIAPARVVEVMVSGAMPAVTERVTVVFAVRAGEEESVTAKVTVVLPLEVGSPEITPLLPRLSPAGNALEDQV